MVADEDGRVFGDMLSIPPVSGWPVGRQQGAKWPRSIRPQSTILPCILGHPGPSCKTLKKYDFILTG